MNLNFRALLFHLLSSFIHREKQQNCQKIRKLQKCSQSRTWIEKQVILVPKMKSLSYLLISSCLSTLVIGQKDDLKFPYPGQKSYYDPESQQTYYCRYQGHKPSNMIGQISFKKVLFNYPARKDVKILNGLDLEIDPGKTVALVGPSGCGKSTCVQLIQRFYDPDQGNLSKGIVNKTIKR